MVLRGKEADAIGAGLGEPGVKAVLFDFDGTLADSEKKAQAASDRAARAVLGRALTTKERQMCLGRPLHIAFEEIAKGKGTHLLTHFTRHYTGPGLPVEAYPGVVEMLNDLVALGLRLAIVTSKPRKRTRFELDKMGLTQLFEVLVGLDDVTFPKPHPEPVRRALKSLSLEPSSAVYVGDQASDVLAAQAAGVAAWGALWGPGDDAALSGAGPLALLREPAELKQFLATR